MSQQPTISVIIPNYNYGRFLPEAINSVLNQTVKVHEIIIVDDGSTDNSKDVLASYGKQVHAIYQQNRGVGAARNAGVNHSTGDYLAFLDADDYWLPEKIARQLDKFYSDDAVGMVTCAMREFDVQGKTILEYNRGKDGWCAEEILLFNEPVTIGPGSTALVRREIFEKAGGFDETKEMHPSEDWEFSYRVARLSKVAFVPEMLVEYRNHGGNGHLKIPRFEQAMLLAYQKIFRQADPETLKFQHDCYANLHTILAGSYFQAGNYSQFLRHTIKTLILKPQRITYYLDFPRRRWKRKNTEAAG